jgi:hypothetical protein
MRPVIEPGQVRPVRLVIALDLDAAPSSVERGLVEPGLPTQSSRTCTLTPFLARSASASANSSPIEPSQ